MRNVTKNPRRRPAPAYTGESDGLQPGDSVGNRQKFSETRISADDIGNRLSTLDLNETIRDDIGNSIGGAPTHQQSGILASFDARGRRRREPASLDSRGSGYAVGGVNPLVSGSQALLSMFNSAKKENDEPITRPMARVALPKSEGAQGAKNDLEDGRRINRRNDKGGGDSSDRWLKRLLEFDDDERSDIVNTGDPKLKAKQARAVLSDIFEKAGVMAALGTEIILDPNQGRPSVLVSFEDIDLTVDAHCRLSEVFATDSISLLALNFLVNKIVNRVPEERVRVQVSLRKPAIKSPDRSVSHL